jgi:hypothetical protein
VFQFTNTCPGFVRAGVSNEKEVRASLVEEDCDATTLSALVSFSAKVTTEYDDANAVTGSENPTKRATVTTARTRRVGVIQIRISILYM